MSWSKVAHDFQEFYSDCVSMSVSCPNAGSWKQSLDLQPGCSTDLAHMGENVGGMAIHEKRKNSPSPGSHLQI